MVVLKGEEVELSCAVRDASIKGMQLIWRKDLSAVNTSHSEVREITQVQFWKAYCLGLTRVWLTDNCILLTTLYVGHPNLS